MRIGKEEGRHHLPEEDYAGGADRSYGVEVAKLAGIPDAVIQQAKIILEELEEADINKNPRKDS